MDPLVSILIPAFDSERWIAQTLESALAQTWARTEVIVVDDGSTDQTLAIAKRFASRRVKVVRQGNQGASGARNTAFSFAQGDYIQWLDADDLLAPDKVQKQVEALDRCHSKRSLLSGAWGYFSYRPHVAQFTPTALWCDLTPTDWLVRKLGQGLHMQTDNWLVSRELSTLAGSWDTRLKRDNDGEYFCRIILASDGVRFVPQARSYYRKVGHRSVNYIGSSREKLESLLLSLQLHVRYLRSLEDSERTRAACLHYLRIWLPAFYQFQPDLVRQLEQLASELGGCVGVPSLPWKYAWVAKLFGWRLARHAQLRLPRLRIALNVAWDKALYDLERTRRRDVRSAESEYLRT
jgi:glycosyltransferase involved in cell wall biosynthesis